jgi:hypothetical protein
MTSPAHGKKNRWPEAVLVGRVMSVVYYDKPGCPAVCAFGVAKNHEGFDSELFEVGLNPSFQVSGEIVIRNTGGRHGATCLGSPASGQALSGVLPDN